MEIKEGKMHFSDKQEIVNNYAVFSTLGCNSVIYSYNPNILMKVLNREVTEIEKEIIDRVRKNNLSYFSTPVLDIEIANKLYGYTMQKLPGGRIEDLPRNYNVDTFFQAFNIELEKELLILAKDRIQLFDIKFDNVLFNMANNKMLFLDIDGNMINQSDSVEEIYYNNLGSALNVIVESLLSISVFSFQTADLGRIQLEAGKDLRTTLYYLKDYLEEMANIKINNLGDFARCRTLIDNNRK